jgi:hypothetical protein
MRLVAMLFLASLPAMQAVTECPRPKPIYKVTKLSLNALIVTCTNGADPTGERLKPGNVLLVSCGK